MKRFCLILLCAALLCGCAAVDVPQTTPTETMPRQQQTVLAGTQPPETLPAETVPPETLPAGTAPPETVPADPIPYTLALHAAVPIYGDPSYDEACLRIVGEDGVYTIVEEVKDPEGNLWGRLKSGVGWVDLSALDMSAPVTAAYADNALLESGNFHAYSGEASEWVTRIAFRAREPLTDVQLSLLDQDWENGGGYLVYRPLYILPALEPGMPLVAEVVFYGDMTAYGLSFTDAAGAARSFVVTVSGRNGDLVTREYAPGF